MDLLTPVNADRDTPEALGIPSQDHPLRPFESDGKPIATNKFYTNWLLEDRNLPAFPHPYALWWSRQDLFWGLAVSHTTADQRVFGPDPSADPCQYFFHPAGIMSMNLGALEMDHDMALKTTSCNCLSVMATATTSNGHGMMQVPLVNGMGLVSAKYYNLTPVVQSQVGFKDFRRVSDVGLVHKYEAELFNGVRWVVYLSGGADVSLSLTDPNHIRASSCVYDILIQVGSCPPGADSVYDSSAGCYATRASLQAQGSSYDATYRIKYDLQGTSTSGNTLIYALPHQVECFTPAMAALKHDNVQLDSTVMGKMTACVSDMLEMTERLPLDIGLLPWASHCPKAASAQLPQDLLDKIRQSARKELDTDVTAQCRLDSMYFSGKALDKFAFILLVVHYVLKDADLAREALKKCQDAFAVFSANSQPNPLVYDSTWKGLVSKAGLDGDPNADFGNSFYNDHHFHYSYFIHAASVIGCVDAELGGKWIEHNQTYVNLLVRDVSSPVANDPLFPQFRSFDWYSGHSWAKGLFLSGDGKDEESTSEDMHFAYALQCWGRTVGDRSMETRGSLMMAIMARSMNKYMLYSDDHDVQPPQMRANRVSGITFENKIDHATYFGMNPEYVQGIHMIPMTPALSLVRKPPFVEQEWRSKVCQIIGNVDDGWKGVLVFNQALYDPKGALDFFNAPDFESRWLDGGMSLTWTLAFCGALTYA